ncbi:pyocin knob domain-containing protein [Methanobrevibacter sp.]|uniref:pyocin knob domain-containing protein n=1 Tax=Methanobrevibacter sp. TaxID=66852 RepID=UPI0038903F54
MTKLTNAEKDKLDNTCGNLRVTKLGTHVKSLEDFVNEGALATRANDVTSAINELYGMIANNECADIQIPPPGFFTLFGNDEDGKLYVYYNDEEHPPIFHHVETPGELEGTLYLYIADPEGENHFEMEIGHYIAVKHLDNYYTKAEIDAGYAIKNHASTANTYGLGSTSKYGHVKTINGLTQASHADGLALSAYQGKVLKTAVDEKVVTVEKQSSAEQGYAATYVVKQNGSQVGVKINIPKDFLVKSTSVKTCTTANQPVNGYEVGDIYIDWVVNSKDNTATDEHLYLRAKDIGSYPPDEVTLTIVNNQFKIKDGGVGSTQLASDSVLTAKIKDANVTTAKIKDGNVTTAKIKDGNVTTAKIADSNVTTAKIADGAVTNDKVTSITKNKISDFSHAHGNLQNDGKVGTTDNASKNVVTDGNGEITTEAKPTVPTANSTASNIKMDGTQSAGSLSTFAKADHVHPTDTSRASTDVATQSANGLMSSLDKTKLDGIATGANKTTVDSSLSSTSTNPVQNKVIKAEIDTLATKEEVDDIIAGDIDLTGYVKDTDSRLADDRIPKVIEIDGTVNDPYDLDLVYGTGFYIGNRGGNKTSLHTPDDTYGSRYVLLVQAFGLNTYIKQVFTFLNNGKTYTRFKTTGNWSSWTEISYNGHTHHDTDIDWEGVALANQVSPLDMAMYEEFSTNRLAYLTEDNIIIESSTDNGNTWTEIATDATGKTNKKKLVTTKLYPAGFQAGNGATKSVNNQLRITLKAGEPNVASKIYLYTRKLMIYFSTGGCSGCKCKIETSTYGTPTTWTTVDTYNVGGYSGWNSIPLALTFGGFANQTNGTRIQNIRLTFTCTTIGSYNFNVQKIRLFGESCWTAPSTLAETGHVYTFDENQNVTFPGKIIKDGGTSSQFLKADGSVDSTTYVNGAGTGLTKDGASLKHSNSVTADITGNFKKLTYDSEGHITGTVNVQASDLPTHSHGASDLPTSSTGAKGIVKLVNDLTTGGTDKALTAEQGKVLNTELTNRFKTRILNGTESEHNNLNKYITPGFYYNKDNTETTYIDNLPNNTRKAFTLLVENQTNGYGVKQTLTFYNTSDPQTFVRIGAYNATETTGWGAWKEIAWTSDIPTIATATPKTDSIVGTVGTSDKYAKEDHQHPHFDFFVKGTDNSAGYIGVAQIQFFSGYQDTPIVFTIYQRDRTEKSVVQVKFLNVATADPTLASITHSGYDLPCYLYKVSAGTWNLIIGKGHANKYGGAYIQVDNCLTNVGVTKLDTHIDTLPTGTTENPLSQSTYTGFSSTEKTKLAGIATGANKVTKLSELTNDLSKTIVNGNIADSTIESSKLATTVTKKSFIDSITMGASANDYNLDNLNTEADQGKYYCHGNNIGNLAGTKPWTTSKAMILLVYNNTGGKVVQEAYQVDKSSPKIFWRTYNNGQTAWSSWQEVASASNIPAVENSLSSNSTTNALSAAQGKVLNTAISNARVFKAYIGYNNNTTEAPSDLSNMSMVHGNKIYFGCTDQNNDYLEGYVYVDFNNGASFTKYTLSYGWYAMTVSNAGIYNIRVYFADSVNRIVASGMCHVNVS